VKVALLSPWDNAWVPYFRAAFESRGHKFTFMKKPREEVFDVVLHGWATGDTPIYESAKNIVFLRRYELFDGGLAKVQWEDVSDLICVNSWIKTIAEEVLSGKGVSTKVHLIYNGTDINRWRFKERGHGKRIGMACHVHPKKNLPLAIQVLGKLPEDYSLHIAGDIQDPCTAEYLNHLGKTLRRKVYLYGHVPTNQLSLWWEQMNYCLSSSISEGNPNNVIEAMAKGLKPVIHNWPGAEDQFPEDLRFSTPEEAAQMITGGAYESSRYRGIVEKDFSLSNIDKVVDLALETA
jgi:glycosyltransferase involved in cell wall biosynthesis